MLVSNRSSTALAYTFEPKSGKLKFKTYYESFDTPLLVQVTCVVNTKSEKQEEPIIDAKISAKMNCFNEVEGKLKPIYVKSESDEMIKVKDFDDCHSNMNDGECIMSDIILDRIIEPGKYMLKGQEGRYLRIKKYYRNEVITFHELHRCDVPWSEHQNIIKQLKYDHINGGLELYPMRKYVMDLVKDQVINQASNDLSIFVTKPENLANLPFQSVFQIECEIESKENYEFTISYITIPKSHVEAYLRDNESAKESSDCLQDN